MLLQMKIFDDLTDSIRARQDILKEFEEAVSKVIDLPKEAETITDVEAPQKVTKTGPIFKEEIVQEFFAIAKRNL
jgi:hypothetical protein